MPEFQLKKKPRKRELSETDKEHNREIAKQHVEIEHRISDIKLAAPSSARL